MGGERKLAKKKKDLKLEIQQQVFLKYSEEPNEIEYQRIITQDVVSLIGSFDIDEIQNHLKDTKISFPTSFVFHPSLSSSKIQHHLNDKSNAQISNKISDTNEMNFEKNFMFPLDKKSNEKEKQIEAKEEEILEQSEEEINEDFDEIENEILLEENDFLMQ